MAEKKRRGRVRWIALGTVLGVVAVWGGFGLVGAATSAPTAITTCTKASNGKTKVIATSAVAKCTNKGKGFAKNWADARYASFGRWQECDLINASPSTCGSNNFTGLDFSNSVLSDDELRGGNFAGDNFTSADLNYDAGVPQDAINANFAGANFTNAYMYSVDPGRWSGASFFGATWNDTTCPDGTLSNSDGGTCVNNLNP